REKKKCCESIRDFVIRQNVYEASKWTLHNRSSSLPRLEKYEIPEFTPTRSVNYQVDHLHRFSGDNGEKLNSDNFSNTNNNTARRLRLPVVPLPGSSKPNEPHQDVHSSNHLCSAQQEFIRQQQFATRSKSASRKCEVLQYGTRQAKTTCLRGKTPPVRATLVALDQCGLRTVLVEKTQPGPLGFYVAIGTLSGQRGIFISRISIASLSPMLSVGDEILYVDDEHVRGWSLETLQTVISGKTKILLVLLPVAGNYVY
ncbi:hypothetical protein Angca_002893, partial [Angiostrongylus cantonensis]